MSKTRLTPERRSKAQREALERAENCKQHGPNIEMVLSWFCDAGIPFDDIQPGENVLTFHAWKAKGRSVKKGEKGCPVTTWITRDAQKDADGNEAKPGSRFPRTTYVFHVSQTETDEERAARKAVESVKAAVAADPAPALPAVIVPAIQVPACPLPPAFCAPVAASSDWFAF